MEEYNERPVALAPVEGSISLVGSIYRILISGEDTAGAIIDMLVSPDGSPGPHAYAAFEESSSMCWAGKSKLNPSSELRGDSRILRPYLERWGSALHFTSSP